MNSGPPSSLSLTDKQKYRERLCAEVDGLRRQVEELRQHVQNPPNQMTQDPQQQLMAQLQGTRGLNSQQFSQQHHRANILNSLGSGMGGGMGGMGQDIRHSSSGMTAGAGSIPGQGGLDDGVLGEQLLQRKQAELNDIIERQQELYSNLDSLDRQRSQILGDIDKTAVLNLHFQGQAAAARFGGAGLPGANLPSSFPTSSMHGGQMRPPSSNIGAARDALNRYPSTTMDFLSNRTGIPQSMSKPDIPPSLMNGDITGGFGNGGDGTLNSLRGRFAKLQEMEGRANQNDPVHLDKRARFLSNALGDKQKQQFGRFSAKNFHDQRISSSYLPSEIMVTPKNPTAGDSLSVLSSSHQLLMSQREANMQRETQNMLSYMGMNNGRHPGVPGLGRQRLHDGKLPETKRKLSKDFVPEVDTVVLGKGNIPKTNIGNLKLKGIVMDNLVEYANGERRKKIAVISRIITHVTAGNYKTTGFVKFEDDCWWEMTERDARVKITALFRDCLHDQYRSSSSSKVKRRQELRKSRSLNAAKEKESNKDSSTGSSSNANTDNKGGDEKKENDPKPTSSPDENKPSDENSNTTMKEEESSTTNNNASAEEQTENKKRKVDD